MCKRVIIFIIVFLFFSVTKADVISVNSGGTDNVVLTPGANIDSFFFCIPTTCARLGYTCGTWSDGCARTLDCGSCSSGSTCSGGTCVASGTGGGGGATAGTGVGTGGGGAVSSANIDVNPKEISLTLAVNTNKEEVIRVRNRGGGAITLTPTQSNLDNMVIFKKDSLEIGPGDTEDLHVVFVALNETGIFTGKILIGGKEVLVSINVKTKLLLFDSNIVVLNKDYRVPRGDKLRTRVTLVPLGDKDRLDVTLDYVIKDYNGKVYLTQSETILVERQIDFNRNFNTGGLPLGNYIVGLELKYPGGVAPSSAHFEIITRAPGDLFAKLILYLIIAIFIILILIVILLIRRRRKNLS